MHQVYVDIIVDAIIEHIKQKKILLRLSNSSSRLASLERRPIWFDNEVMQKLRICLRIMSGC